MLSKSRLKELCAYRQQKLQDCEGVFIVEGAKMAAEALQWGAVVRCVCATGEWLAANQEVSGLSGVYEVSPAEMERLTLLKTPSPVWMLVERKESSEFGVQSSELSGCGSHNSELRSPNSELVLALDRLQDPGNMGTIMRTADWYGVRRIVCSRDTVSCFNPKVVQGSMGAVFRTRVDYVDLPQWLASCGMTVFGASLHGEPISHNSEPLPPNSSAVLLIGNEGRGISPEAMAYVTRPVLIPNRGGTAESLNAAVAAAILMDKLIG